jgi:hypothetical protein
MHFHVFVVGYRGGQTQDVLAAIGVETVEENGVGCTVFAGKL